MKAKSGMAGAWWWAAVVCGGLGVFEGTQAVVVMRAEGMHHAWVNLFFTILLGWVPWAAVAPVALRVGTEYPLFQGSSLRGWLRHVGLWFAIWVGATTWNTAIEIWLNPWTPDNAPPGFVELWRNKFYGQLLASLLLYGVILLVGWMVDSREKLARQQMEAAQLSEQLAKAQLSALRQQIEPHFLFNTLNTIAGLVREGRGENAVGMIAGLSELLRRTLQSSDRQEVTLGEELEIVEKYLEIEKARFAERLQVRVEVAEELRDARVPSLILQPVVENAVKHGIAKRVQGGTIGISAARANGTLELCVKNDGPEFPVGWEKERRGIGLENVRERLGSLYGGSGALRVEHGAEGAMVTILVPYKEDGEVGSR
ncbi:MAG: sensor histidine kinase [Candidatus Acidiferrum sp.]